MKFYIVPEDELMHYGVPGMRRGVRKYTNPDGTLTAAGRARYFRARRAQRKTVNRVGTGTDSGMRFAQDAGRQIRNSLRKDRIKMGPAGKGYQGITKQAESSARNAGKKKLKYQAKVYGYLMKGKAFASDNYTGGKEARNKKELAKKMKKKVKRWNSPISVYTNKR